MTGVEKWIEESNVKINTLCTEVNESLDFMKSAVSWMKTGMIMCMTLSFCAIVGAVLALAK